MPTPAPRPAVLASNILFLPTSFSTADQLRASVVPINGAIFFADSSDAPVKRLDRATGSVTALAVRMGTPTRLALQGTQVVWTDGPRLVATSLGGTGQILLADANLAESPAVLADADAAYWVRTLPSATCSPPCVRNIERVAPGGTVVLAQVTQPVVAMAQDATSVYWEESGGGPVTQGCNCGSMIKRIPKVGGSVAVLVDASLNGLLPPPPPGHLPGSWLPVGGLATDGSTLYFADTGYAADRILSAPAAGGGRVTTLASLSHTPYDASVQPTHVAGDAAAVYWTDATALHSVSLPAGPAATLGTALNSPADLVLGPDALLLVEAGIRNQLAGSPLALGTGGIRILPRAGGAATFSIAALDAPTAAAFDASAVYWTEAWRVGSAPRTAGSATTLASGIGDPLPRIAVTGQTLLAADGPFLKALPVNGGTVQKVGLIQDSVGGPLRQRAADLVTDGTDAFVAFFWPVLGPGARRIPLGGGPITDFAEPLGSPQTCVARIAADAQYVYWTTGSISLTQPYACAIVRAPRAGGASTVLADAGVLDFALLGGSLFLTTRSMTFVDQTGTHRVGVDGLSELALGGALVASRSMPGFPNLLGGDAKRLAWLDGTSAIAYLPISLAGDPVFTRPAPVEPIGFLWVDDLVSDGSSFFFTDVVGGTISMLTPAP